MGKSTVVTARRRRVELGHKLRRRRQALGMRPVELAVAIGYTNRSKGARRVTEWERGEWDSITAPERLEEALQLPINSFAGPLRAADEVKRRMVHLGQGCLSAETRLLKDNIELLLSQTESVLASAHLASVRSPIVSLRILWLGGGALDLAGLLDAWRRGVLVAKTDEGPVYVFEGAGSVLSGAGKCTGVNAGGQIISVPGSPSRLLRGQSKHPWRHERTVSSYSLADAIVELGGTASPTLFYRLDEDAFAEREPLACYDPHRKTFSVCSGGGGIVQVQHCEQGITTKATHGKISVSKGPPRTVSLGPEIQLGGFQHEDHHHSCGLALQRGVVVDGEGGCLFKVDGPSPPPALLPLLQMVSK